MTAGYCQLHGPRGGQSMLLASEVQDTWTEMIDANGLSLFEIMKGMSVNQSLGSYSSGAGFVRIRNRQSGLVKMLEPLSIVTEEKTRYWPSVTIQDNDIIEEIWVTPPT